MLVGVIRMLKDMFVREILLEAHGKMAKGISSCLVWWNFRPDV